MKTAQLLPPAIKNAMAAKPHTHIWSELFHAQQGELELDDWQQQMMNYSQLPAGVICDFAGDEPPYGWVACDGKVISVSEQFDDQGRKVSYKRLYDAIGTNYGGSGNQDFKLPLQKGKIVKL